VCFPGIFLCLYLLVPAEISALIFHGRLPAISADRKRADPAHGREPAPVSSPTFCYLLRKSLIWATSTSASSPWTMAASSRDSAWEEGQPRQCIPARIKITAIF